MSSGNVLVTDPIGGDLSVIVAALDKYGLSVVAPGADQSWLDLASIADGVIVNLANIDHAAFSKLRRCKIVARLGVGVNNVDIETARRHDIIVTNVPDYCREEVTDHALAMMLALVRKIPSANADVQHGDWGQLQYRPIRRLNSLALGLVGYGRLAQVLARKALSLGMRVMAHDPYVPPGPEAGVIPLSLDELFKEADIVSLHAPLGPATRGLLGREAFAKMKRGAILINTSRGELVDEAALLSALEDGSLSAAGLDVFTLEPLAKDSPLRGRHNVLLTPHMAFYSEESLIDLQLNAAEDVARVLRGQSPRFRVA